MRKLVTLRAALGDPALLADALPGDSWHAWRILLIASVGEALDDAERVIFTRLTGREREPGTMVEIMLIVAGRRSGKTKAIGVLAVYLATLCEWSEDLSLGERGLCLFLAPTERQATVAHGYAEAVVDHVAMLCDLVESRTATSLTLQRGIDLEVQPANWRFSRGGTAISIVLDECAFLYGEDAANSDTELMTALKPSLATTGGPMLLTSSPSTMEGIVYRLHKRHFGPQGDPLVLVVQADTLTLNPSLSKRVIERAYQDDPVAAEAEYGGQFRQSVSAYLERSVVERAVVAGISERVPEPGISYFGFVDVAGGSGTDSFTCAIAHKSHDAGRDIAVLDALFEVRPPFDPDQATARCAKLLGQWGVNHLTGDSYASQWPVAAFARNGIGYSPSPLTRSELYLQVLPLFTAGRVQLLDSRPLVDQFCGLKRKVGLGGREIVDHVRGSHDDLCNSVAGVFCLVIPCTQIASWALFHFFKQESAKVISAGLPAPDFGYSLGSPTHLEAGQALAKAATANPATTVRLRPPINISQLCGLSGAAYTPAADGTFQVSRDDSVPLLKPMFGGVPWMEVEREAAHV